MKKIILAAAAASLLAATGASAQELQTGVEYRSPTITVVDRGGAVFTGVFVLEGQFIRYGGGSNNSVVIVPNALRGLTWEGDTPRPRTITCTGINFSSQTVQAFTGTGINCTAQNGNGGTPASFRLSPSF